MSTRTFENERWNRDIQKVEFRHSAALALLTSGRALDIGCGDGLFLRMLQEKGIDAEGADFSDVAISKVRAQGFPTTLVSLDELPLPFSTGSFNVVTALDVLEHLHDPAPVLAELARIATDSVVVSVPNFSSLPARMQVLFGNVPENNRPHKGHIYWFTWKGLLQMAKEAGLVVSDVHLNAPLSRIPVLGRIIKSLVYVRPQLFALSFVVRFAKESTA